MDEEKSRRYQKRHRVKQQIATRTLRAVPDKSLVEEYLNSPVDMRLVENVLADSERRYALETKIYSSPEGAQDLLTEIKRGLDKNNMNALLYSCRDNVIDSIIRPFGLSTTMFNDKDGGNVTTLHNFKDGVVATNGDADRYKDFKDDFNRKDYETKEFVSHRRKLLKTNGPLLDSYTSNELPKDGRAHLDHVVSAHEIDQDPRAHLFLSKEKRTRMANSDSNLAITHHSINQSKSDMPMEQWMDKATKDGTTKARQYGIDQEKATAIDKTSRKQMSEKLRKAQLKKQTGEVLSTGISEGVKMGFQQSLGLLLREFVVAVFDEATDIFNNGFKNGRIDSHFFAVLKDRLTRVGQRVISKWEDILEAFRDGTISAFFSNLITFIINSLATTVARAVRVIREGFFSLLRALKIALFPPHGLTPKEAAHEATKLIGVALVTAGGILIEEAVDRFIQSVPVIGQIASLVTPVIMGLITGITSSIVVYLIDKVDLLGVVAEKRHAYVVAQLDGMIDTMVELSEASYSVFQVPIIE